MFENRFYPSEIVKRHASQEVTFKRHSRSASVEIVRRAKLLSSVLGNNLKGGSHRLHLRNRG